MSLNFNALSIIGGGSGGGSGAVSSAANTSSISTAITAGVISSTLLISTDAPPVNTQGISNIISSAGSTGLLSYFPTGPVIENTSSVLQITGLGRSVGATLAIQVNQASGSTSGYLSSTDWTTFNNKSYSFSRNDVSSSTPGVSIGNGISTIIGASPVTIDIQFAATAADGLLSSTDWNTFNNKVDPTRIIGTTFPLLGGGDLSADRVLSMPIANGTTGGYLSATDWNTFNGKQSALTVGAFSYTSFLQGATLFGATLTIGWADATNPGSVGTTNQIFAGLKTFNQGIALNSQKAINVLDPTNPQDAATKNYVDTVASGLNPLQATYAGSTVNIVGTYLNGVGGVGAIFTVTATGAFTLDGTTPPQGSRILLKDQSTGFQNGVYDVTNAGGIGVSPVLTRSLDYNTPTSINAGDLIPVINGTVNNTTSWLQTATVTTVGTDALVFVEWTANPASYLLKANNLSDVTNANTSLNNILPTQTSNSGKFLTTDGTDTSWATVTSGGSPNLGNVIENLGLSVTMAANAATINLLDSSGSTPSGGSPVNVGFRDPTVTTGTYNIRSITGALSTVLANTDSGGTVDGVMGRIYIYLIDNSGTPELAWAGSNVFNENNVVTTITSGGSSTLYNTMYSTTGRTGVPFRYIGYFESTQTTAGVWATAASLVGVYPASPTKSYATSHWDSFDGYGSTNTKIRKWLNFTEGSNPSPTLITTINDATNGFSVMANRRLRITIAYSEDSAAQNVGISKNSTQLTTNINAINTLNRIAMGTVTSADEGCCVTVTDIAKPGDIYRCHTLGAGIGGAQADRSTLYILTEEL